MRTLKQNLFAWMDNRLNKSLRWEGLTALLLIFQVAVRFLYVTVVQGEARNREFFSDNKNSYLNFYHCIIFVGIDFQ